MNYYAQVAASLGSLVQVSTGTAVKVTQPTYSQLNPGSFTTVDDVSNTANFTVALPSLASTSSAVVRIQANASVAGDN
ncbi:hypothetical protein, partial [Streptomyces scabiei]|uniref:hypothetical protein n=1 Tax=Streptomyces scabiei TaxID=1930 RepID=UPI0038F81A33